MGPWRWRFAVVVAALVLLLHPSPSLQAAGEDETTCPNDTFQCDRPTRSGTQCLPMNWVCDGDKDCHDGKDELDCGEPTCSSKEFQCGSNSAPHCIKVGWTCDGERDCQDGSDESPQLCQTSKSKGSRYGGATLSQEIHCLPNQYLCPELQDRCVSMDWLCDGKEDCTKGEDEGAHCVNRACATMTCEMCRETRQGPLCFCKNGYMVNQTTGQCVDLNECHYELCDQVCVNTPGSYACSCVQGYRADHNRCLRNDSFPEPALLMATAVSVEKCTLEGERTQVTYPHEGRQVTAMDYDYKNNTICFLVKKAATVLMQCSSISNPKMTWTITTQYWLTAVEQIAKDWVSGNWYFADGVHERIFLCTEDGSGCLTVIQQNIKNPKNLALDPTRGLMFYTDWSDSVRVWRASMDGKDPIDLVRKKIVHPSGLTLDLVNQHVYWGDTFLDYIERINYDGSNRRVVARGLSFYHVSGMEFFMSSLYVSNLHNRSITLLTLRKEDQSIPSFFSVDQKPVFISDLKPTSIRILHALRQPPVSDKDLCRSKGCQHFCLPVPHNGSVIASCACREGFLLENETQCTKKSASQFLMYANAQQGSIHGLPLTPNASYRVIEPVQNLHRPMSLAVHVEEGMLYYSDVSQLLIGRRKINGSGDAETFLNGSMVTSCEGLAVDWVGRNLYYVDDGRHRIGVVRLDNASMWLTLIEEELFHPRAITLDPERGMMYWANWVLISSNSTPNIEVAEMDGSGRKVLVSNEVWWPNSLTLDRKNQILYWTDGYFDRITSISLVGDQNRKIIVKYPDLEHPYGIAVFQDSIFWTESLEGIVFMKKSNLSKSPLVQDSAPIFDLVFFDTEAQSWKGGECAKDNGGCSDFCLTKIGSHVCRCATGRKMTADAHTCEDDPSYVAPGACQENIQFKCRDGSCINSQWLCDGDHDCSDGSDEDIQPGGACDANCKDPSMFQCKNKRCIHHQFVCDGEDDCMGDNTDEGEICQKNRTCPTNYTMCEGSRRCIPDSWICDHQTDCPNGSDEQSGCNYTSCSVDHFRCFDGGCIPYSYRCDNEYDCPDHSDELLCGHWCDPQREFKCKDSDVCLPIIQKCDREKNCKDGSDEVGCPVQENLCRENEYACNSTDCIPGRWVCDGDLDCPDGSDETVCDGKQKTRTCHESEFACEDRQRCIPITWKCDREFDCTDNSDEKHCSHHAPCEYPNFQCSNNSNVCLPPEKLCDGHSDCANSTDEGRLCQHNLCINHDCSHICHKSPNGYVCSCPPHKRLQSDKRTCISMDVCKQWGICSQNCSTMPDGYRCTCFDGYTRNLDGFSCKPNGDDPIYLILSLRHEIRRIDLHDMSYVSLVSGLRNTIAVDFHVEKKLIFWADVVDDKIYRGTVTGNTLTNIEAIIDVGLTTTEGLAIDWITDHIYWVESKLDQIEVAALDGSHRSTLMAGDMVSPRAIVVDPRDGLLFWTDWDPVKPRIVRCAMNGDNRMNIYDIQLIANGGWPNGLALDYEVRRLYWVDARSDSVHTITYDGQDMRTIMHGHENLGHPFALTLFEHYIYWTDWRTNTLSRANKFNGSDVESIQNSSAQPFDLQVYHPYRQPYAANPCGVGNGGCSHLCLLGLHATASCHCPHRMKINPDDHTQCIKDDKFLLFVRENEIRGVNLENAHFNVIPSITVPFVENATAIDYDAQEERLYWTDVKRNVINSAYLNGTGVETIIDKGISNPRGFAIDWLSRNMYFSTYNEQKAAISVARLNGAFRTEIINNDIKQPNSIAIHPKKGVIFWSDVGLQTHRIMRANMDGSNPTLLVNNTKYPSSLTVDERSDTLYWISRDESRIYSCQLTEAPCSPSPAISDENGTISMTIYQNSIYYADTKTIKRHDTQLKNKSIIGTATPNVYAMQVYDASSRKRGKNGCMGDNGGCEQLCLPTGPNGFICRCTAGFTVDFINEKRCVGIRSFLLYSIESEIRGQTLEGDKQALPPISKISHATAVDFHAKTDHIYWVDSNQRSISRIKRDLSDRQTVVKEGINVVEGLAVDWVAGNIYWTDRGHDTVEVARLDGRNRTVIIHGHMDKPRSIVVHPSLGYLFFADVGNLSKIERARLDGSERMDFINTSIGSPYGLAVDHQHNYLYWCDKQLNKIERVNILTGQRDVIREGLTDCVALTVLRDTLYWADMTVEQGSIKRINLTSGEVELFHANLGSKLKDIKIFDASIQDGTNKCSLNNGGCAELCLYRGNGHIQCACSYGRLANDNKTCEDYDAYLLYSKVTAIESIHMTEDSPNAPLNPIQNPTHMKNVIGLTFSYAARRIFFSDIQRGDIQSVAIDGTDFKVVVEHVGSVEGLAFDSHNNTLYWTSYTNSSISRLRLSSTSEPLGEPQVLIQLSDVDKPRAIVLHACVNRIFWTNWNDRQPSIQTAYMNGFKSETIISNDIRTPNGLAIDHRSQKLYWSDARLDKIERCNLDGSNRIVIVTSTPHHSFSIAVYGDFVYWTDWVLRAVMRANKYDGSGVTRLKKNIERQPMALVAMANDTNDCTLDPCYKNQFGCDEICTINLRDEPECLCRPGHFLLPDGKRCSAAKLTDCPLESFLCADKLMCVPPEKTCNGVLDCLDNSDEDPDFCKTRACPVQYFQCANRTCIHTHKRCDGVNDCGDGSDEEGCPCKDGQFQCANGMCIPAKYRCDRDTDCTDHSDEVGCNLSCDQLMIDGEHLEGLVPCNTTSACIYHIWLCDGSNDCWDNSDEENCTDSETDTCMSDAFRCDSKTCIPSQWRCDKDNDCRDNSDEMNCTYTCEEEQFACNDSHCIQKTWVCDGHPDCPDHSDEPENCVIQQCKSSEFRCSTGRCIPNTWKCDGESDCDDGADETIESECPPVVCQEGEMQCANRRCIRSVFYCDHDNDCGDDSDEPGTCEYEECMEDQFKCEKRGMCIAKSKRCDGFFNCPDHSDEANCTADLPCGNSSLFLCANKVCVPETLVCNGRDDCGDGSDEPSNCGVNECLWTAQCGQRCVDQKIGFRCECNSGYRLRPDNRTCEDINECNTTYPCAHYCTNTLGRYSCSCAPGYNASNYGRYCHASGDLPVLLVSNRYYIRKIFPQNGSMDMVTKQLTNSVAIDFDYASGYIYWSDITTSNSSINRIALNDSSKTVEVLHNTTVRNPDGLAVDWVGRNLYWCDKTTDTIEVSRLDGRYRKVIFREKLQEPRGLEVFPARGFLYFTDWGDSSHISRIHMDGTNWQAIIKEGLAWPNALTIDYVTEKIFWADGSLDYIGMANLDGSMRRNVISDNFQISHIFALTTFEDKIYWTDWEKMGIFYAHKFTGENITQLNTLLHRPMDIQVYHELRQVPVKDSPCENYGSCSHLCLLRPTARGEGIERVCGCPENHYLASDKLSCISNCTSAQFLCNTTSKCIPSWWKCDGHSDCEDHSDEPSTCGKYLCERPGLFQCKNATSHQHCILPGRICDGFNDCDDHSDEEDCESYPCLEYHFKCRAEKKCISKLQHCDNHKDCANGEDEQGCPETTCKPQQFKCKTGQCVPYVWHCDNDNDCGDWSDEPKDCVNKTCKEDHMKCNISGRCIPDLWKCDGDRDCGDDDDSDEKYEECHLQTCEPSYFRCDNNHCIPGRWQCDFVDDCKDGSDERGCKDQYRNCSETEFRCDNGRCIHNKYKCDDQHDCEDGSDEANCKIACKQGQFQCQQVQHCIPDSWRCDGDTDCADNTDEWHCTSRSCPPDEFRCNNTICLPSRWQCDGEDDCGDNSDENVTMCKHHACPAEMFRCRNHTCIWRGMACDGSQDCADGSDEENCTLETRCSASSFKCFHGGCVKNKFMCDGIHDCRDMSDEDSKLCESFMQERNCSLENGGCQHHCQEINNTLQCSCKANYTLADDRRSCKQYNPCHELGKCSQICQLNSSFVGGILCSCDEGYEVDVFDHNNCLATGGEPYVMVAAESVLLNFPARGGKSERNDTILMGSHAQTNPVEAMALDTSQEPWTVFVLINNRNQSKYHLQSFPINPIKGQERKHHRPKRSVVERTNLLTTHSMVQDIAVDWVSKHVYRLDTTKHVIELENYDSQRGKTIVSGGMDQPQGIELDPIRGKMFWSDKGRTPRIEMANLDGSNRTVLVDHEMLSPTGLALDLPSGWLYWADSKKHTIEAIHIDGHGRRLIHKMNGTDPPYKLDVFEDFLLVVTWRHYKLLKMDKWGRSEVKTELLYTGRETIHDVSVVHHSKQKKIKNVCQPSPCIETQLCLRKPSEEAGYVCLCPDNSSLNGKKCDFFKPEDGPCPSSHCLNNGNCTHTLQGNPKCSCPPLFRGDQCQYSLCQNYCLNGGTCHGPPVNDTPVCRCKPGYSGHRCNIFECTGYCLNGGLCSIPQPDRSEVASVHCTCPYQYTGPRCENKKKVDWCHMYCVKNNTDSCGLSAVGGQTFPVCNCKTNFTGKKCEACSEFTCYNEGVCRREANGNPYCDCPAPLDPITQCKLPNYTCKQLCTESRISSQLQGRHLWPAVMDLKGCDCHCSNYSKAECQDPCHKEFCLNNGTCSVDAHNRQCTCSAVYSGVRCEHCNCKNEGKCLLVDGNPDHVCKCPEGFSGPLCEVAPASSTAALGSQNWVMIIIPVIIAIIVVIVIIVAVILRKRRRMSQYGHKRIRDGSGQGLNVSNPVYLRSNEEEPMEPEGTGLIYTGEVSTNFANPMYEVFNADSMQMLLNQNGEEESNHLLDDHLGVRYSSAPEDSVKKSASVV